MKDVILIILCATAFLGGCASGKLDHAKPFTLYAKCAGTAST